jgi:ornithine cyclodeaminase/alanine dehydrogenase-like protein (mu-crystallin family)
LILGEASARESADQTVIFELTRLNIWAVSVANWAYQWAVKEGIGTAFAISGGR